MKKRKIAKISGIGFLIVLLMFSFLLVSSVPDEIILFKDEKLNLGKFFSAEAKTDGSIVKTKNEAENYFADVKLAGVLPVKTVKVSVVDAPRLIPGGNTIGVKLHTDGLIVVGLSSFKSKDGTMVFPAKYAGVQSGDIIKEINGEKINDPEKFSKILKSSNGNPVTLTIERENKIQNFSVKPVSDFSGELKLGIWVRSSVAGIGTMTYYNPQDNTFGALGHGIADSDTNKIVPVSKGQVVGAEVVSVVKSEKGTPGELRGSFVNKNQIGDVVKNTNRGIYGDVKDSKIFDGKSLEVASRNEIKEGDAKILCCINGETVNAYNVQIQKVSHWKTTDTKCMVIKITDEKLLGETGGILQGMSGSPIIQEGKIIGAVTHVFVNDPTRGYGIFIENMLSEAEKQK